MKPLSGVEMAIINDMDAAVILKAQMKVLQMKRRMTWRSVCARLAKRAGLDVLNPSVPFDFVRHNDVPSTHALRKALFLPKYLPSERVAQSRGRRSEPKGLFEYPSFQKVARDEFRKDEK